MVEDVKREKKFCNDEEVFSHHSEEHPHASAEKKIFGNQVLCNNHSKIMESFKSHGECEGTIPASKVFRNQNLLLVENGIDETRVCGEAETDHCNAIPSKNGSTKKELLENESSSVHPSTKIQGTDANEGRAEEIPDLSKFGDKVVFLVEDGDGSTGISPHKGQHHQGAGQRALRAAEEEVPPTQSRNLPRPTPVHGSETDEAGEILVFGNEGFCHTDPIHVAWPQGISRVPSQEEGCCPHTKPRPRIPGEEAIQAAAGGRRHRPECVPRPGGTGALPEDAESGREPAGVVAHAAVPPELQGGARHRHHDPGQCPDLALEEEVQKHEDRRHDD